MRAILFNECNANVILDAILKEHLRPILSMIYCRDVEDQDADYRKRRDENANNV